MQSDILQTTKEQSKDSRLIKRAIAEQWPVKPEHAKIVVERLIGIVQKTSVTVPAGDGVFESESEADKNATRASALLATMVKSNHAKQSGGTTVNVGVNVDNRIDERRNRTLAIAERFGTGRILSEDRAGGDRPDNAGDQAKPVVRRIS
jgi:hypothetical protein